MVPFSFENVARSAGYDASHAVPVSDAARATHESFESHLQRGAATTVDQPAHGTSKEDEPYEPSESTSTEPPSNKPTGQVAGEGQQGDGDARTTDHPEATTASETAGERNKKDAESHAASDDPIDVAADELSVALQDVKPEASAGVVAAKVSVAPGGDEISELDASLATKGAEPAEEETATPDNDIPAGGDLHRAGSDPIEHADSETPTRQVKRSETNEEVAVGEFRGAATVSETPLPDDESPQANDTPQRHAHRGDISHNKPVPETTDTAQNPVATNFVETAADTAGEESSQQRQRHREADGSQPTGKTSAAETTAAPGTPSRFAQHLLARAEDPNARGVSITNADQTRFVDRVARAVQVTGERQGTLRLRLSPPELGSLTLEVKVQGGVVSARVDTDTPAARSLLLENLPLLRERLAEHGMRVDQFDVDLSDREAGGTPDGLQQQQQQQHEDGPRAKATLHDPEEPHMITNESPIKIGNEQLNIIV